MVDIVLKTCLRNCSMSVALPVMSDLHLGQMAASKLDLKTSEHHPEHQSNEKSFDCKVQSVLPALSADEVSLCALEDVGGGTHFLETHLRDSGRDGLIRTMSNIPKDEYWAFWKSLWWC